MGRALVSINKYLLGMSVAVLNRLQLVARISKGYL